MSKPKEIPLQFNNLEDVDNYLIKAKTNINKLSRGFNTYALTQLTLMVYEIELNKQLFLDNYTKTQLKLYGAN